MNSTRAVERIRAYVRETPLVESGHLGASAGTRLVLKLENCQETGSFKLRGAANKLLTLPRAETSRGVVAASSGNHALGVATIGRKLGIPVEIFLSKHVHPIKRRRIEAIGARVREIQGDELAAELAARDEAEVSGRPNVSPYNDSDVIEGQGTIAVEILRQLAEGKAEKLDAVFVAVGGGGLISGIGIAVKALSPSTRVIGVEVAASCPFTRSLAAGRLVTIDVGPSLADGLTGNLDPDTITLDIVRAVVDQVVVVDEPVLRRALAGVVTHEHLVIEGAAAAGPAAILDGQIELKGNVVVILTGANIDAEKLTDALRSP